MPSMTTKRLGDLEAERTNLLLYERRIIDKRDEILTNVTIHLDKLDAEIVRRASSRPSSRPPSGVSDEDGIASSSATVEDFSSTTMNDGRSAISSRGLAVRHGMTISAAASRGFERRSSTIEERIQSSDRGPPSSSSSEDPNEEGAHHPFVNGAASSSMVGERCDASTVDDASKGRATTEKRKNGRKRKRQSVVARDDDETTLGEPWTCECGHEMAAGRARCGKCRRWKGGKRLVRWSVKPRDPTATIAGGVVASPPPSSSSSLSGRRGRNDERGEEGADIPTRAIDAYRNACSDSNATVTIAADDSCGRDLAIHSVLEQMVLAVAHISDPVRAKKKTTVGSRTSNNGQVAVASMKGGTPGTNKTGEIVTSQKRKRGRPRKETNGTDPEQILRRSVSNSGEDSSDNNGPEDQRKRGRPRKTSPAPANKDAREGAKKQHQADGLSSSAARATLQHHPSRDVEEIMSAASDGTLSPSTVIISTGGDL
jgi:hypothetical protein